MPKASASGQGDLFAGDLTPALPAVPDGWRYQADLLNPQEEAALARDLAALPFAPFEFHGYLGNRRVVAFGLRYDYGRRAVETAAPLPDALAALRRRVGAFAGRPAEDFVQCLVNEYREGAGIGWHRDKPQFGEVVGVSLLAPCAMRLRRRLPDGGFERLSVPLAPRSAYLLSGPARSQWEHSITPMDRLRYSVTFRTLA
ncbi:alpha-ketoglutarate-dependent dioxygenase AlkB [Caulobacter sp. KR2-114]|uniref:alpha-ketoglutarate-dependent dioxygenase AlkB n=1 Tax=Caulobacter sp. KR2-114 TaxID=3400912 RepID=UPI003C0CCF81